MIFIFQKSKQIVISEAVNLTRNGFSLRPAVWGVVMGYEYVREVLFNLSQQRVRCQLVLIEPRL